MRPLPAPWIRIAGTGSGIDNRLSHLCSCYTFRALSLHSAARCWSMDTWVVEEEEEGGPKESRQAPPGIALSGRRGPFLLPVFWWT